MSAERPDKLTMSWTDYRGKKNTRAVNQIIDVRDFIGTPGYSLLIVAANTHLSISDIVRFLTIQAREYPAVQRSLSWIQRRRWLFQKPDADNTYDRDGNEARALTIMADYPTWSLRDIRTLLKDNGITRSHEWVRKNRYKALK